MMSGVDYRYILAEMFCRKCARRHQIAFEMLHSGTLSKASPRSVGCYACQLAGVPPEDRVATIVSFAQIWRCATKSPLPPELQI